MKSKRDFMTEFIIDKSLMKKYSKNTYNKTKDKIRSILSKIYKSLPIYYILFFSTLFLIFLLIFINYKTTRDFDPNYIKSLPWEKRTSFLREVELISKLKNKKSYKDEDLAIINELISVAIALKDEETLKFAEKIKYDYLINSLNTISNLKFISDFTNNLEFRRKMGLFMYSNNDIFLKNINKNLDKIDKIILYLTLWKYNSNKLNALSIYYTKDELNYIENIINTLGDLK
ncbi:hypothetical protein [Marinitoga sp. 38H-ov]|uniref:hypothetical protein n=1 Tax=Marinitoga sp. 38H-ov TaxID=1755814 RepID=UPI0013E9C5C9|nr:hypothetical protein [Marinitoga sp. 38H-ov]KAF2955657.1 hypothetical protein AS160_00660 [Marinitoga sp. 38H-ov]